MRHLTKPTANLLDTILKIFSQAFREENSDRLKEIMELWDKKPQEAQKETIKYATEIGIFFDLNDSLQNSGAGSARYLLPGIVEHERIQKSNSVALVIGIISILIAISSLTLAIFK